MTTVERTPGELEQIGQRQWDKFQSKETKKRGERTSGNIECGRKKKKKIKRDSLVSQVGFS